MIVRPNVISNGMGNRFQLSPTNHWPLWLIFCLIRTVTFILLVRATSLHSLLNTLPKKKEKKNLPSSSNFFYKSFHSSLPYDFSRNSYHYEKKTLYVFQ